MIEILTQILPNQYEEHLLENFLLEVLKGTNAAFSENKSFSFGEGE